MASAADIYQQAIKRLAAEAVGHGSLSAADASAVADNPLCGDRVEMQVRLDGGVVAALAHQVKGCLLCRAAASIIGKNAIGVDRAQIERIMAAVAGILNEQADAPPDWPDLAVFAPVHGHPSRYRCVVLPFEALLATIPFTDP